MYELIGEGYEVAQKCIGGDFEQREYEEIVATFDTEQMANDYITKSRLATETRRSFSQPKVFRNSSLLSSFSSARVEKHYDEAPPPHNPT